jgi:hypothetical protein
MYNTGCIDNGVICDGRNGVMREVENKSIGDGRQIVDGCLNSCEGTSTNQDLECGVLEQVVGNRMEGGC